jgi:hypothetical protein
MPALPDLQLARLVAKHFPPDRREWAMAIALAESGGRPDAQGDPLDSLPPSYRAAAEPYACRGYTSIGLWQIHLPAHRDRLRAATNSTDPCHWAAWLTDPENNARVAADIADASYRASGDPWKPWTAYTSGTAARYLKRAADALAHLDNPSPTTSTPTPGAWYLVRPGDTLYSLAQKAYGRGDEWPRIYEANRGRIGDNPNLIIPGTPLWIPPATVDNPDHALAARIRAVVADLDDVLARLQTIAAEMRQWTA